MIVSYAKSLFAATAVAALAALGTSSASAAESKDRAGIESTLSAYNAALNSGSTAAVLPLYTDDGIFMPPYSQSAIGPDAVRAAYDAVFKELKFNVKFNIAELVQMAPKWAYVRTNSAGTTAHASTGKTTSEAIRSSSSSRRATTAAGGSRVTAFPRRTRPPRTSRGFLPVRESDRSGRMQARQ